MIRIIDFKTIEWKRANRKTPQDSRSDQKIHFAVCPYKLLLILFLATKSIVLNTTDQDYRG
jgi:hypothetical protein